MKHEVLNQPPPLVDYNLFSTDGVLCDALVREGGGWAKAKLESFGRELGRAEVMEWGATANENPPVLRTHDRFGRRRDEVEFHPAWHNLMRLAVSEGIHNLPWASATPGAHVARAAMAILASQNEAGHMCPISMTYSAVPVLRRQENICREWLPRICSTEYDPSFRPASQKAGALMGMALTEKQGGSDVRANLTRAEPLGGGEYHLHGHKWFCSAPMSDAFLVTAQAPGGLSCFLLPRWKPDGTRNAFYLQRLKSKLGNRSNASSEVEFDRAWAQLIGEEGRGIATIMGMVHHTRLDCILASAALMRRALKEAIHHASHRCTFGRRLLDQPLMRNVLSDLALESDAAILFAMRVARAFDEGDYPFARLAVAAGKFWITKRAAAHVAEALECLGGNGFVEESILPRLYREAPLNSIWEGSGNVIALDILRAVLKEPESLDRFLAEVRLANDRRVDSFLEDPRADMDESGARRFAQRLALSLEASLLIRFMPGAVADAFCGSRLASGGAQAFGTLPRNSDWDGILRAAG